MTSRTAAAASATQTALVETQQQQQPLHRGGRRASLLVRRPGEDSRRSSRFGGASSSIAGRCGSERARGLANENERVPPLPAASSFARSTPARGVGGSASRAAPSLRPAAAADSSSRSSMRARRDSKRRVARACELRPASLRRPIDPVQPVTHRRAYRPGMYYNDTRLPRPTRAASRAAIPRSPSSRDRRRPGTGPARKNF